MDGPVPELEEGARDCAETLLSADRVVLASHIDADGLTSAAVAATALERAGLPFETVFEKQLDDEAIARLATHPADVALFTDFGSGQAATIESHAEAGDFVPLVVDHHQPAEADLAHHLNPLLFGLDGASELSGAGAAYVLARALDAVGGGPDPDIHGRGDNRDLASLAVVGAVGDMQASGGELVGANRGIVAEGEAAGVIEEATDLAIYGKQTRPLPKLIEYASDVRIPGLTNDEAGVHRFLDELDVDARTDGGWRTWVDLTAAERQAVASGLVRRAVQRGVPAGKVETLVGTSYTLPGEPEGTALRDASEFSTLLNATARYERADVGLAVCLGDRDGALRRARSLLTNHRRNLSEGIDWVERNGVTREEHLQWFHAGDAIRETIVGIVAGMAMGADGVSRGMAILAFAEEDEETVKVSARGTHRLVRQGLDLSAVMSEAAAAVGGEGGGHDVAAGASVPAGAEREFVETADRLVGEQLA